MRGPHDLGGLHGLGPIPAEQMAPAQPGFGHSFEGRVHGMAFCVLANGAFNGDEFRYAIERLPWDRYLGSNYYERSLSSIENLLDEKGLVSHAEIDERMRRQPNPDIEANPGRPARMTELAQFMVDLVRDGSSSELPTEKPARFGVGDSIMVRNLHERSHNRLPGYMSGKPGTIHAHHGAHRNPGPSAMEQVERPAHLYSVRFSGRDLWGPNHDPTAIVYADLFEDYLEDAITSPREPALDPPLPMEERS